ncbi:MAG: hypothetical protein NTV49_12520 [Kiritimatiellaeota bacterium]|nr:hypothetical protein [Kiritimatiellota bacterium]
MNGQRWLIRCAPAAAAFVLLLGLYTLTSPRNHSEANDAYAYARSVEAPGWSGLCHGQHLLYLPVCKGLFIGARQAGLADRAFPVMIWFSRVCGALAVVFFALLLLRRLADSEGGLEKPGALRLAVWTGAGGLACSYGFWRYSNEAEIYIPATLFILLAWRAAAGRPLRRNAALSGLCGALGCLLHIFAVLPTFAALPLFYLWQRRVRHAALHVALAGALCGAAYLSIYGTRAVAEVLAGSPAQSQESGLRVAGLVKGAVGLTQDVTAGNFLFARESFQRAMTRAFPCRALNRQIYTGQHADGLSRTVPFVTLALLALTGIALLALRWTLWRAAWQPRRGGDPALAAAAGVWFGLHVLILWSLEPGNPENWVMALPPLWLLIATTLYAPLAAAGRTLLPVALTALLLAHNYFGGLRLLAHADGDYCAAKAAWYLTHAAPGDLIITAENDEFVRYLGYYQNARIVHLIYDVAPSDQTRWLATVRQHPGRVFATPDVFQPLPSLQRRFPARAALLASVGRSLAPDFVRVATNEFGGVVLRQPAHSMLDTGAQDEENPTAKRTDHEPQPAY